MVNMYPEVSFQRFPQDYVVEKGSIFVQGDQGIHIATRGILTPRN
jgi:hypothetical protein